MPNKQIVLRYLVINKPVILRGTTGTLLKINNGPIIINIKENEGQTNVVFSEIKIIFEEITSSPKPENYSCLFKLNNGSMVELIDCHISSINASTNRKHICFQLNTFKSGETISNFSILTIISSTINDFYQVIRAGENAVLSIEKSYISGSFGKAIVVLNPLIFKLFESVLENNQDNSVHIKIIKNDKNKGTNRRIFIENNELKYNFGSGIYLEGYDQEVGSTLDVIIQNNIFKKNGLTGVFFCELFVCSILCEKNKFVQNKGNGINFQKVMSKSICEMLSTNNTSEPQPLMASDRSISVTENFFVEMETYGVFVNDTFVYFASNHFSGNKLSGMIFCNINYNEMSKNYSSATSVVVDSSKVSKITISKKTVVIDNCTFKKNGGNGLKIVNFNYGILVENSKFIENCENGIYLEQEETMEKNKNKSADSIQVAEFNVVIRDCEVCNNMKNGLKLVRLNTLLENTSVKGNLDFAINIPNQDYKKNLKISNKKNSIEGTIGGDWGEFVLSQGFECNMCCSSVKNPFKASKTGSTAKSDEFNMEVKEEQRCGIY